MSNILNTPEYKFVTDIPDLILVGYGGSYAYGTNTPTSDIDIRGIYANPPEELIGIKPDSEQITRSETDTVIYSFRKMTKLLYDCNPNTIELLGLRPCDYLYMSAAGLMLLDNRHLFLSKKAVYTFGNYANSQLNRLINKSGRGKDDLVNNEVRSMKKALSGFASRYNAYSSTGSKITVNNIDENAVLSMNLNNVPIKTIIQMLNELASIDKDYSKSVRNTKAIEHNKLNKHMMHLFRLYMMGIDILEKGEIITYREEEHDLLMSIRNGDYLESDMMTPNKRFEELLRYYQNRFNKAAAETKLPDKPDFEEINKLVMKINKQYLDESTSTLH